MWGFHELWEGVRCPRRLQELEGSGGASQGPDLDEFFVQWQDARVREAADLLIPRRVSAGPTAPLKDLSSEALAGLVLEHALPSGTDPGRHSLEQLYGQGRFFDALGTSPVLTDLSFALESFVFHLPYLVWHRDSWHGILVRSSTKLKDSYIAEAEVLRSLLRSQGVAVGGMFLIHPLDDTPPRGMSSPRPPLGVHSLGSAIKHLRQPLGPRLPGLIEELRRAGGCGKRTCPVCSTSLPPLPEHHIYQLYKGGRVVSLLEEQGILDLGDVASAPPSIRQELSRYHQLQLAAVASGRPVVDAPALGRFLDSLVYPLYLLDFECTTHALPPMESMDSWELVPFMVSVAVVPAPGAPPGEVRVIHTPPGADGRHALAHALAETLQGGGTPLGYGTALERRVLEALARINPAVAPILLAARDALRDLQKPFAEFWYYHPNQKGKTGLKVVLPLFTADNHSQLELASGGQAHLWWFILGLHAQGRDQEIPPAWRLPDQEARDRLVDHIKRYAAMDAEGLWHILKGLQVLVDAAGSLASGPPTT